MSRNNFVISPTRQLFASTNEPELHHTSNQHSLYRGADLRLPPDLLQYGQQQHQTQSFQSSSNHNSSSSTGSNTSTVITDHRNQSYTSSGVNSNSINRCTYMYSDGGTGSGSGSEHSERDNKYLAYTPIDEPDLRIYHNDIVKKPSNSYAVLNSTLTLTASRSSANKRIIESPTSIRSANMYELTQSSAISNPNYSSKHMTKTNPVFFSGSTVAVDSATATTSSSPSPKVVSNNHCKLKQSVVRTSSSSYSFLPAGYQHQDNFL